MPGAAAFQSFFRSAAWYALSDEDIDEIFAHEKVHVDDYIQGIVTTGGMSWPNGHGVGLEMI
jgi:hypothetical protein